MDHRRRTRVIALSLAPMLAAIAQVSGGTVRFQQAVSTFVQAGPWLHAGKQLTHSGLCFGGPNTIAVVLARQWKGRR